MYQAFPLGCGKPSSGLAEVPFPKADNQYRGRQDGRLRATSVIDCKPKKRDIVKALHFALSNEFQAKLESVQNLMGMEVL